MAPAPSAAGGPVPLEVRDLGRVEYGRARDLQQSLVAQRLAGECGDLLLVCEHDPVLTAGRATESTPWLADPSLPVVEVERGGQITWHGPGQIVVYPIARLADDRHDLHGWMRALEEAAILALGDVGLPAGRRPGATGVWVGDGARKIMSIGVAARRWVTWHGLALNHDPDLARFDAIRPCGFDASVMTSVVRELGAHAPSRERLVSRLVHHLQHTLAPFREHATADTHP